MPKDRQGCEKCTKAIARIVEVAMSTGSEVEAELGCGCGTTWKLSLLAANKERKP